MKTIAAIIALLAMTITLALTISSIWFEFPQKGDLMQLTELLLDWQVISGGLVIGAGHTFGTEINKLLNRIRS
jgi:hypothetical protein